MSNNIERRKFLASATATAAAAVVGVPLKGLKRHPGVKRPLQAARDARLAPVEHVVILMQENRSFDHYYGMLKGVRGFGEHSVIDLPGTSSGPSNKTVFQQPAGSGSIFPWQLSGDPNTWEMSECRVGPTGHSWPDQHQAWNGGLMDNWYAAKGSDGMTMGHMSRTDIPFNYALADAYTICDAYHCSVLSGTGPNRNYLWSGSIGAGLPGIGVPSYNGGDFRRTMQSWQTYAEALQNAGVDWKVYQVYDPDANCNYGDNGLEYFAPFMTGSPTQDGTQDPALWQRGVAGVPYSGPNNASDSDDMAGAIADALVAGLRNDISNGTLPKVSWIVTDAANSEHPNHSPSMGARMVKRVLEALNQDQAVFNSTVVLVTYDENDGFFDHVPPPVTADTADSTEFYAGLPIGLGFRVPMLIVSPWTRGGRVNSQVFDHSSVLRFLESWTGVSCPNISAWRRAVCGDLTSAFDFANPVFGPLPTLPDVVPAGESVMTPTACDPQDVPSPPAGGGTPPAQESGNKAACPLPYQVNAYLDRYRGTDANGSQTIYVNFENLGARATSAAHFAAYVNAYRTGGPWQYTVGPNGTSSDFFNIGDTYGQGKYDLTVTGPNRFLRRFKGDTSTDAGRYATVKSYFAPQADPIALWFRMTNGNPTKSVVFTIHSNHYRQGTWTYHVGPGQSVDDFFNQLGTANGWYDFTITVSNDPNWSQRFIGHIENGTASTTGSIA